MPNVGDVEYKYGRIYMYLNPNPALGPGTWRVSNPDELGSGGGTIGGLYDFDGEDPIVVDTTPGATGNPTEITTSIDLSKLDDRAD